jgi:hypothetical protein
MSFVNFKEFFLQNRYFYVILLITIIVKLLLLFTSQRWADGDESVTGVMALHLLKNHEFPIYYWGQHYSGGGAVEAYLAAIAFVLLGVSSISLKTVPLVLFLISMSLLYFFFNRTIGPKMALWFTVLYSFSSPLVEWCFKMRGGYLELLLYAPIITTLFFKLEDDHCGKFKYYFLLGFFCGFSYYSFELISPLFVVMVFYSILFKNSFRKIKHLSFVFLGSMVGFLPCLVDNIKNNFLNLRYMLDTATSSSFQFGDFIERLWHRLPAFFMPRNVDGYMGEISTLAKVEAAVYLILAFYTIIRTFFKQDAVPKVFKICVFFSIYFFIELIFITTNDRILWGPRFYLALFFPLLALTAYAVVHLCFSEKNRTQRLAGWMLGIFLLSAGVWNHAKYFNTSLVTDNILLSDGRIVDVIVQGNTIKKVISLLKENEITAVRTPYFTQWRIIFESQETILASSHGFWPRAYRYPLFDEIVNSSKAVAILLHRDAVQCKQFDHVRQFRAQKVDDYILYLPVTPI